MIDILIGLKVNDRYQVLQHLGAGGLGAVYKARDLELDREVAIKVVQPDALLTASNAPDLFLKEAKIIAALDHPNILTIYDIVQLNDPEYPVLLVTKLAKGGSLHSRLHPGAAARPLTHAEADHILEQVAAALDHAHSQRVIHLDIKPSNILFSDETGQLALVADFGLARLLQTTTHVVLTGGAGTPSYMPQEQLIGGDAGRYSDVYALGITLYEMLTGEVPKKSFETSGFVVQLTRPLPDKIRQVIERATMLDPHQRYQSAGELARAFKAAQRESGALIPVTPEPSVSAQPEPFSDFAPTVLRLPTKRLTDREKLRDVLRDLGQYAEMHPGITEQDLNTYVFKPGGLFSALGYDKQDKNVFSEQYRPGIVLLMVKGHPLAVMEFKGPVFSITDGLEQLERQYIARLYPDVGVLCNGRELWIYRRTGAFLFHPPALRLLLSQVGDVEAEAVYNWLGRRDEDAIPETYPQFVPPVGGYSGGVQPVGPVANAGSYPSIPGWSPSPPNPPYPPYPVYPPSGSAWSTAQAVKRVSRKAKISIWLGALTLPVGAVVVTLFYEAVKGPGELIGQITLDTIIAILEIITVVLGHAAIIEIRRSNKQMKGTIRAIFGLIIGYLSVVLFLLDIITRFMEIHQ